MCARVLEHFDIWTTDFKFQVSTPYTVTLSDPRSAVWNTDRMSNKRSLKRLVFSRSIHRPIEQREVDCLVLAKSTRMLLTKVLNREPWTTCRAIMTIGFAPGKIALVIRNWCPRTGWKMLISQFNARHQSRFESSSFDGAHEREFCDFPLDGSGETVARGEERVEKWARIRACIYQNRGLRAHFPLWFSLGMK